VLSAHIDWGGPTLKNRSGVPIGAILSALAPRQVRETHAPLGSTGHSAVIISDQIQNVRIQTVKMAVFSFENVSQGQSDLNMNIASLLSFAK
jgi:hypothetical protein